MSWSRKRVRERRIYKRKYYRALKRRKKILRKGRIKRNVVAFPINKNERAYVMQEGTPGFVCPRGMKGFPKGGLVLTLPEVFDFDVDYRSAATVISIFRRALIRRCRIGYIDFARLKKISPACLTVFSCYADLWKMTQPKVTPWTHTWTPEIIEAFRQIGFFETLGFDTNTLPDEEKVESVKYMGLKKYDLEESSTNAGEIAVRIRREIESFVGMEFNKQTMFASVSEAIRNIIDHAYTQESILGLKRKWWLSVSYDKNSNIVHIIIFDRGMGIPTTMLRSSKFSEIRKMFYKMLVSWSQKDRLQLAFERYRNPDSCAKAIPFITGRGRGCQDLLQLVEEEMQVNGKISGILSVISQRARYEYKSIYGSRPGKSRSERIPLEGTLLEWRIKKNEGKDNSYRA